jgi:hypothetical protein
MQLLKDDELKSVSAATGEPVGPFHGWKISPWKEYFGCDAVGFWDCRDGSMSVIPQISICVN